MDNEPVPYREGEAPPSPRHVRALLRSEDGSPGRDVWIDADMLKQSPPQHADIDALLPMLRWQWRHIGPYAKWCRTFEDWELGFMRDSNPGNEVAIFTRVTYALLEFARLKPKTDRGMLLGALIAITTGRGDKIKPASMAAKLSALLDKVPPELGDPANFTEDGKYKIGDAYFR